MPLPICRPFEPLCTPQTTEKPFVMDTRPFFVVDPLLLTPQDAVAELAGVGPLPGVEGTEAVGVQRAPVGRIFVVLLIVLAEAEYFADLGCLRVRAWLFCDGWTSFALLICFHVSDVEIHSADRNIKSSA